MTSNKNDICKGSTILALNSRLLIINLGGGGGDKQMKEASIQCPNDGVYDASTPNISLYACQISLASSTLQSLLDATIIAVEGLHDVNIYCDDTSTCIDTSIPTTIQCTTDGSSSCALSSYNTCGTAVSGTADCQTYVLTSSPTEYQSFIPTFSPNTPTGIPTTFSPSMPTIIPTSNPTIHPSFIPTVFPTNIPSFSPSVLLTFIPTSDPTEIQPTNYPSLLPIRNPTQNPSQISISPTYDPSSNPTYFPTENTSPNPTHFPTNGPTFDPTIYPSTMNPTYAPTANPTNIPTENPTNIPTANPTNIPIENPTNIPIENPTNIPTASPTNIPTENPTNIPTVNPTNIPIENPTNIPTANPTNTPTANPTLHPSIIPTTDQNSNPFSLPTKPPFASSSNREPSSIPTSPPTIFPNVDSDVNPFSQPTQNPAIEILVNEEDDGGGSGLVSIGSDSFAKYLVIIVSIFAVVLISACIFCLLCFYYKKQQAIYRGKLAAYNQSLGRIALPKKNINPMWGKSKGNPHVNNQTNMMVATTNTRRVGNTRMELELYGISARKARKIRKHRDLIPSSTDTNTNELKPFPANYNNMGMKIFSMDGTPNTNESLGKTDINIRPYIYSDMDIIQRHTQQAQAIQQQYYENDINNINNSRNILPFIPPPPLPSTFHVLISDDFCDDILVLHPEDKKMSKSSRSKQLSYYNNKSPTHLLRSDGSPIHEQKNNSISDEPSINNKRYYFSNNDRLNETNASSGSSARSGSFGNTLYVQDIQRRMYEQKTISNGRLRRKTVESDHISGRVSSNFTKSESELIDNFLMNGIDKCLSPTMKTPSLKDSSSLPYMKTPISSRFNSVGKSVSNFIDNLVRKGSSVYVDSDSSGDENKISDKVSLSTLTYDYFVDENSNQNVKKLAISREKLQENTNDRILIDVQMNMAQNMNLKVKYGSNDMNLPPEKNLSIANGQELSANGQINNDNLLFNKNMDHDDADSRNGMEIEFDSDSEMGNETESEYESDDDAKLEQLGDGHGTRY